MRQLGTPIKYLHLCVEACKIDPVFAEKTEQQQYHLIRRLCIANCLVPRRATHRSQSRPQVAVDEAKEWLLETRPVVSAPNVDQRWVINMDQTPLSLSLEDGTTLELQGESTVNMRGTGGSKTRTTVCLAVSAAGQKLKEQLAKD